MNNSLKDRFDENGKSNYPDFFSSTRIFKGDGKADNSDSIRILRKHVNGFYLVIKIFNLSAGAAKYKYTVKYHYGDINKMFRLDESWNMVEQLTMTFAERLDYIDAFENCLLSWRRHSSSIRNSLLMSDLYNTLSPEFVAKQCNLFADDRGKFRFIVTIRSRASIVIKFSQIHKELIFTAKYRFEKVKNFAEWYNMDQFSNVYVPESKKENKIKSSSSNGSMTGHSPAYMQYFILKDILAKIFVKINNFNNDIIGFNNNDDYQIIRRK